MPDFAGPVTFTDEITSCECMQYVLRTSGYRKKEVAVILEFE